MDFQNSRPKSFSRRKPSQIDLEQLLEKRQAAAWRAFHDYYDAEYKKLCAQSLSEEDCHSVVILNSKFHELWLSASVEKKDAK